MFRSYDHHQDEKYITTLGLLNSQRIRCQLSSPKVVIYFSVFLKHRVKYVVAGSCLAEQMGRILIIVALFCSGNA
jgi:hypothetical protein